MFKLFKKIQFSRDANRMKTIADVKIARDIYNSTKSQNLKLLLKERFDWMNKYIGEKDVGIEVGSGAGFTKDFIKNENFKLTDMNRILKKNGKLIIFDAYCSVTFQIATAIMKHEGFDFTVDVWNENKPISDERDVWDGNIAITNLIFDDKKKFNEELGNLFLVEHEKLTECLIFLNSGGVTSKTFYIPLNRLFFDILKLIDKILIKVSPNFFCLGRRIVLVKK